jgi:hypothetical protein
MRANQGASYGRYGELYRPEMFNNREEGIVFKREEFVSAFKSMMSSIEHINDIDLQFNRQDDYKLLGLWPQIMSRVHIIDVNIDDFLMHESSQGRLDAYLHSPSEPSLPGVVESGGKIAEKPLGVNWFK